MGGRSARAIDALKRAGFKGNLVNLKGGSLHGLMRSIRQYQSINISSLCLTLRLTKQQGVAEANQNTYQHQRTICAFRVKCFLSFFRYSPRNVGSSFMA